MFEIIGLDFSDIGERQIQKNVAFNLLKIKSMHKIQSLLMIIFQ